MTNPIRPVGRPRRFTQQVMLSLTAEQITELDQIVKKLSTNRAEFLRNLFVEYLQNKI